MKPSDRRAFLKMLSGAAGGAFLSAPAFGADKRKMKIALTPGSIGVKADQREAIELAHRFGYEAVEPYGKELAAMSAAGRREIVENLEAKGLVWAAAGLPVDFRRDEALFESGMKEFPKIAQALEEAGATRIGTWVMPTHDSLTYLQNFRRHARRLRKAAQVCEDHGQRLGLEYVGTKTLWTRDRFPFVHTMAEMKDLIGEIGRPNVGFVLDSWHWWNAGETADDIRSLTNDDVVSVDLNDAPLGVPKDEQIDGQRMLPRATGLIPLKSFLRALEEIGYDGPVRPEPFNQRLNELPNEEACKVTIRAMKEAFALIGG